MRLAPPRTGTDLDILAFRFPRAHVDVIGRQGLGPLPPEGSVIPDPILRCSLDRPDMIVGEVKEGLARFNEATRDPAVLAVALARFGCCSAAHADHIAHELVTRGRTDTPEGHVVRMVAFGGAPDHASHSRSTVVSMRHVVEFLRQYLHEHWDVLRHAQLKDPTLGVLALIEKSRADDDTDSLEGSARRGS